MSVVLDEKLKKKSLMNKALIPGICKSATMALSCTEVPQYNGSGKPTTHFCHGALDLRAALARQWAQKRLLRQNENVKHIKQSLTVVCAAWSRVATVVALLLLTVSTYDAAAWICATADVISCKGRFMTGITLAKSVSQLCCCCFSGSGASSSTPFGSKVRST